MRAKGLAINPPAGFETPAGAKLVTPTPDEQTAAKALLKDQWPAISSN
jgi:hypothetical protein